MISFTSVTATATSSWHGKLREVLDKDDRLPVWDDTKIPAGADFESEIREHVSRAKIMIMLVSPDYLSPNCGAAELEIMGRQSPWLFICMATDRTDYIE